MRKLLFSLIISISTLVLYSQTIDMDQIYADEEFRLGVVSFHKGFYNKAIHSLERSLVFKPENETTRQWLGRAYYQSGYEDAALNEWENLIDQGHADSALVTFYDMVIRRRGVMNELRQPDSWVELMILDKDKAGNPFLGRPSSVTPSSDGRGNFYSVSFASNLISLFNPNGDRVEQLNGGIDGFSHPFDMLLLGDGRFLVSEYQGDRISIFNEFGYRQKTIGSTGRGEGQLLGPQFLAHSGEYFYVTDWGNKEIDKYSLEGEFILSFGKSSPRFAGLSGPSGICLTPRGLAVSDTLAAKVYLFDENGNYLGTLIDKGLMAPEGLTLSSEGQLLIADGNRVWIYQFDRDALNLLYESENKDSRILKVAFDENGNLLIPDFNENKISMMTELSTLYGGLFLRIESIESRNYPDVLMDFTIEDAYGNPYVGLDESNFLVKESGNYTSSIELIKAGYQNSQIALNFLVEDSPELRSLGDQVDYALKDFLQRKESGDRYAYYSASETPFIIAQDQDNPYDALAKNWRSSRTGSEQWHFDISLRLAASDLLKQNDRRVLVFFSSGNLPADSFDTYGLVEMASYLKNNNILFYPIYFSSTRQSEELNYLAGQSGGQPYFSLDPQGVGLLLDKSRVLSRGNYRIGYRSNADTDFGRKYLPVILEVNYLRKSGRDELGYFAPIDYNPSN